MSVNSTLHKSIYGIVYSTKGGWTTVKIEDKIIKARIRGRLKIDTAKPTLLHPIAVGDKVRLIYKEGDYIVDKIEERRNCLRRHTERLNKEQIIASNIDQIIIIASMRAPYAPFLFIDSIVVTAQIEGIVPIIIFNKQDIYNQKEKKKLAYICRIYKSIGYNVLKTNMHDTVCKELLMSQVKEKSSLLIGYSGSGKSTMINLLLPNVNAKTQSIGRDRKTGIHTTTFSTMYEIPTGGHLIDSPGIRSFSMPALLEPKELRMYFKEFACIQPKCNFTDCTHTHEKECAVLEAVEKQKISEERYFTYKHTFDYLKQLAKNVY